VKKIVYCFLVLFYATAVCAQDRPQGNPQANPYQEWLTYYYMEKDPTKVPEFLGWLQTSSMLEAHPAAVPSVEGFLSVVFAQNADKAAGWSKAVPFTGKAKEAVDYVLKPPIALQDMVVKKPADIDRMWGAFSASGDDVYLTKIVAVLDTKNALTGDAKQDAETRAAAAWSLGSNMTQHEAVDRFLVSQSKSETGEVGKALKKMVADVEKQRDAHALPNKNGDFSAMLFLTDPKVASKELARASGDIVHFKEMSYAKKGDKRTIVIVFAGMQLAPDYKADVTYDVQLVDPAGKVYSNIKDLEGIKEKVPTRFRIFNNQAAIFMSFDKKDKPGPYVARVTLKDNIGKKNISMIACEDYAETKNKCAAIVKP
jgi:hypothetical protein